MIEDGSIHCEMTRAAVDELGKRLAEKHLYLWADLRQALNEAIRFRKQYEDSTQLVAHIVYDEHGDAGIAGKELTALGQWINALAKACTAEEDAWKQKKTQEQAERDLLVRQNIENEAKAKEKRLKLERKARIANERRARLDRARDGETKAERREKRAAEKWRAEHFPEHFSDDEPSASE